MVSLTADVGMAFQCAEALKPEESMQRLTKVQQHYDALGNFRAKFIQESELAALGTSEASSGEVHYSKPGMMRWDYRSPQTQHFVLKDGTFWFYQPEERQLVIDDVKKMLISELPVAFLLGIGKLNQEFSIASACFTSNVRGGGARRVMFQLIPRSKETGAEAASKDEADKEAADVTVREAEQIDSFELLVSDTYMPVGVRISDIGGNVTTIVFEDVSENVKLSTADIFSTDFPSGIDIQDRRLGA